MRFALVVIASIMTLGASRNLLDPDFEISTEEGRQAFREELAIALTKTPGATAETRKKIKSQAENLVAELFRKGEDIYHIPHKKAWVYWDQLDLPDFAAAKGIPHEYSIHLNEIMFFTYHEDHIKLVIPHEVTHLLHRQFWGVPSDEHGDSFMWMVKRLAPEYQYKDIDLTPGCRLNARLLKSNNANGSCK
jgi:hypothetical protein